MGKKRITLAVLGAGSIGMRHLKVLSSLGAKVIAVPVRPERASKLAGQGMTSARSIEDAKRMGAAGVVVCTDTSRHVKDCMEACDLGMAVLCEKPLAVNSREAINLGKTRAGSVHVAYNLRFDDGFRKVFELVSRLGEIHYIGAECRSYLPAWRKDRDYLRNYSARAGEGGVLLDLSHEPDYINHFYEKPEYIAGITKNNGTLGIAEEEMASAAVEFPGGSQGSIVLDYLSRRTTRRLIVSCRKGEVEYDFVGKRITLWRGSAEIIYDVEREADTLYKAEDEEFIKITEGRKRKKLATFGEAVDALCVVDSWKKSSDSGRKVEIKYAG